MTSQVKRIRAISEVRTSRAAMSRPSNLQEQSPPHAAKVVKRTKPSFGRAKSIYKIIYLKKEEGKEVEYDEIELASQAWYRAMRLQEEAWLAQHIPVRDAVFEEHETTSARASQSSRAALEELENCDRVKE